jgi:hypothetical protein
VTLDIKKHETPNPETESGTTTVKCRRLCGGKKGPVDQVFSRDSSRESKEPTSAQKGIFERSCEQESADGGVRSRQVVSELESCLVYFQEQEE